ncbi:hypothetical protein J2S19_000288 [Metabacillus malikii]|uniref:Lipoprotein n=2 Tax=Metabacillus malikii TaxID=1504265 RepID=A0ABT9ZBR0_9BACI|nr:hypothetical protein [Metabacillus malikii]
MKKAHFLSFVLIICYLVGCSHNDETSKQQQLTFTGESESWNVTGYEVAITADSFKAGNGTLTMKTGNEHLADFFQYKIYANLNGEDTLINSSSFSGEADINIAEKTIGSTNGGAYLDENGKPITFDDMRDFYLIVEWQDKGKRDVVKERIDLINNE